MNTQHKRVQWLTVGIVAASVGLSVLTFAFPLPEQVANPVATHWRAAISTLIFALYMAAAIPLLFALRSFKRELRVAYGLVAWGLIAFSATFVQLIVWGLLDLWESAWAASGTGILPWAAAAVLIYAGARKFALLMKAPSLLRSFLLATAITVAVGVGAGVLASYAVQYELEGVEIYIAACAVCSCFLFCASILMYRVYQAIGTYYKSAIRWLSIGLGGVAVAAAHEAVNTFWFNNGDTYTDYGYYLIPLVLAGLLLVRASYEFWILPAPAPAVTTGKSKETKATDGDYIDSLIAVAGLVSQPKAIDTYLNTLRRITAGVSSGTSLTEANKVELLEAYYHIETYLANRDALRSFTVSEIRCYTTPSFQYMLAGRPSS